MTPAIRHSLTIGYADHLDNLLRGRECNLLVASILLDVFAFATREFDAAVAARRFVREQRAWLDLKEWAGSAIIDLACETTPPSKWSRSEWSARRSTVRRLAKRLRRVAQVYLLDSVQHQ
jgi:hypothetical protein